MIVSRNDENEVSCKNLNFVKFEELGENLESYYRVWTPSEYTAGRQFGGREDFKTDNGFWRWYGDESGVIKKIWQSSWNNVFIIVKNDVAPKIPGSLSNLELASPIAGGGSAQRRQPGTSESGQQQRSAQQSGLQVHVDLRQPLSLRGDDVEQVRERWIMTPLHQVFEKKS